MAQPSISLLKGTTNKTSKHKGVKGEITYDTDVKTIVMHDDANTKKYVLSRDNIKQTTGNSQIDTMSQNAIATNLNLKVDKNTIVQAKGTSTTNIMSQKAVTDELNKRVEYDIARDGSIKVVGTTVYVYANGWKQIYPPLWL